MAKRKKPDSKTSAGRVYITQTLTQPRSATSRKTTQKNIADASGSKLKRGVTPTEKPVSPVKSGPMHIPEFAYARTVEVLRKARWYVSRGWVQHCSWVDAKGNTFSGQMGKPVAWSLYGAIAEAGQGNIEGEYARRAVRKAIGQLNIAQWNDYPLRRKEDAIWALDRAAELLGGRLGRRGGWSVGGVAA